MSYYSDKSVFVTGGHGFLGKHLVRKLEEGGAYEVWAPTRADLDLLDQEKLMGYMGSMSPDIVFHLAAHVGGIHYNMQNPAYLIHDNVSMAINIMRASYLYGAKVVAAGSVCAYPEFTPVPTIEKNLYNGYPEASNGAYGNAKRILLELQRAYYDQGDLPGAHLVSANLYGPGDNFDPGSSHMVPALIVKIQNAIDNGDDRIIVWGTGNASRDLLYVEDAADAYIAAGELIDDPEPVNIASNRESPVHFIVKKLMQIMGFSGELVYDTTKPDGQKRRVFRVDRMVELTGWVPETDLDEGLRNTVQWYRESLEC